MSERCFDKYHHGGNTICEDLSHQIQINLFCNSRIPLIVGAYKGVAIGHDDSGFVWMTGGETLPCLGQNDCERHPAAANWQFLRR